MHIKIISLAVLALTISRNDCAASDLVYGPYEVGFESYKTYDNSRSYISGDDTISRPLLIHFWYPSQGKIKGHALNFKHYIDLIAQREDYGKPTSEIDNHSFYYVQGYSDYAKQNFGLDTSIQTGQVLDAPVYARSGIPIQNIGSEFPLIIYAPSNSKVSVQNHLICEYLASHGFMILSVASAGPNSIQRENVTESTLAQVRDMEHILKYSEDSLYIKYTNLGLFGFSSGGSAITLFQMRNKEVDAVLSMDGSMEYSYYLPVSQMEDFKPEKTNVPYCSIVNNFENYSIYPMYNSVITQDKYMFRMPYLNHSGFISYWRFFDSCSQDSMISNVGISYDYMSDCVLGFFSKYLKPGTSLNDNSFQSGMNKEYIQHINYDFSAINAICNTLLDNNLDSAARLVDVHKTVLFEGENQLNLLARIFYKPYIDQAIWLYLTSAKYQPDYWETHFNLGYIYKEKGETLLAKNELLIAKELNPENTKITDLLDEVNEIE